MPNLRLLFVLLVLPLPVAAAPARMSGICDQAAYRAAQAEGIPLEVLRAITRVETGRVRDGRLAPWPWAVNVEGQGYWFGSEAEAKAHVFNIFHAGTRSFDVGCFQINYRWHGKAFRSIDAMFDPDENAGYAARFLKQLYTELGSWPAAAGAYHSRTPDLAKAYSGRFQTVLAQLDDAPRPQTAQAARDPFTGAAAPLVPLWQAESQQGALGSLMPTTDGATAFIAFN